MAAMPPRPVQPDDLYLLRQVTDPQVSPDGSQAAFGVSSFDREEDETRTAVYVAPVDGSEKARRFTQGKKEHSPRWSPDGRHLAFVSDRGEKNQVFVAPLNGGEPRQVTNHEWGVSSPAWSPDGRRIAYAARTGDWVEPKKRKGAEENAPRVIRDLRYKLDGVGFFDERRMHIFVCDIESGETTQVTDGDYYDDQPAWSPDGKTIIFTSDRERARKDRQWRADLWAAPATGGRAMRLTRARGTVSIPSFSPDGKWIAFVGHENGDEGVAKNIHLMALPASGGEPKALSASIDRPVAGWPPTAGRTFAWAPDSKSLLLLAADRGRQSLYRATLDGRCEMVVDGERQVEAFALAPGGESVVATAVWPDAPWEAYSIALEDGKKEVNLSHANGELLGQARFAGVRRMTYRAPDGLEMEAFVIYPPDYRAGRTCPLAVNVHGGPHSFHPGARSAIEYQALAAKGYVVMLPNPRGSTSYGEAFSEACVRDWGGADFEDIMAGVNVLVDQGVADPARLYIGGYSYGGFMSSWAVGHTDRFRAAVVGAPVSNQASSFGTGDIPLFDMHEIGGLPQDHPAEYAARSPITYLKNCRTPVLLVHHEGDLRCPIAQSEEIFHSLKAMKREVEFVRYPGGFHTYNTHAPSQTVDRIKRTIAWYEDHQPAATGSRKVRSARKRVRGKV
jgi:dipeptidyl aminopeptidase/acylaminoacyl peptidase